MNRVLCAVALCLGAFMIGNGCVGEDKSTVEDEIVIGGEQCGNKVCSGKTFCCNASCGICAPIGGGCTQQACLTAPEPEVTVDDELVSTPEANVVIGPIGPQECGKVTCTGNTHCCNASCGTCVPPGAECTQQFCEPTD